MEKRKGAIVRVRPLDVGQTYGDPFGMNSAQIGVLEERDQIGFARLLQRANGSRLKAQIRFEVLGYFTNEPLKWELANE